jgi:hypothetical protein
MSSWHFSARVDRIRTVLYMRVACPVADTRIIPPNEWWGILGQLAKGGAPLARRVSPTGVLSCAVCAVAVNIYCERPGMLDAKQMSRDSIPHFVQEKTGRSGVAGEGNDEEQRGGGYGKAKTNRLVAAKGVW